MGDALARTTPSLAALSPETLMDANSFGRASGPAAVAAAITLPQPHEALARPPAAGGHAAAAEAPVIFDLCCDDEPPPESEVYRCLDAEQGRDVCSTVRMHRMLERLMLMDGEMYRFACPCLCPCLCVFVLSIICAGAGVSSCSSVCLRMRAAVLVPALSWREQPE